MKTKLSTLLLLFVFLCCFCELNAQDFLFTSQKAKTSGEIEYKTEVNEQLFLNNSKSGTIFELELDGRRYTQEMKKVEPLSFGYTGIIAHPGGLGNSHSNLVIKDGSISGIIQFENHRYRLVHRGGAYRFFEITEEVIECGMELEAPAASTRKEINAGGEFANPAYRFQDYTDTTTVDVLILYTTDAKNWADTSATVTDINEIFAFNEARKNDIIANSDLALKIRFLDYLEIANTAETSSLSILEDMAGNTYTGIPDTVDIHALQNQYGADLVAILDYALDVGGIAYRPNGIGGAPDAGYSVNRIQQLSFTSILMHEIGHNFGAAHGRTQASNAAGENGGMFQFSTGHLFTGDDSNQYVTVMHYENLAGGGSAQTVPYFSNPRLTFQSAPLGTYETPEGPSDNALTLSISKDWISSYRDAAVDPPAIALSTTAIADTVFPAGYSTREIILSNTGDSDLQVKLDGEMELSSSLKSAKSKVETIKQSLDLNYSFEENEGFFTGTYSGLNNWRSINANKEFEISSARASSGSQSLKIPMHDDTPYFLSPYFATKSRYSTYSVSFDVYAEGEFPDVYLSLESATERVAAVWLNGEEDFLFYGPDSEGNKTDFVHGQYFDSQWYPVQIQVSSANSGSVSYDFDGTTHTFTGTDFLFPEIFQVFVDDTSSNSIYIDNLQITAEDLYGPALVISDNRMTIRPGESDTMTVHFYGNENAEGVYAGNIYLETNDPANKSLTIPVDLNIDPNNQHSNDQFAVELTGQEGFRLLSAPAEISIKDFLEPLHTQGAAGADYSGGSPNVWTWDKTYSGTTNEGWNPAGDLNEMLNPGDAILVYVFDESVYGDSTSRGFPKLLPLSGTPVETASPGVNQNAEGLTLVGNPYPSTIDWDEVHKTELAEAVYAYDPNTGNWKSYVNGIGDLTDGLLKPFQGFFIQSSETIDSGPDISFESNDIVSGGEFYGKSAEKKYARLEVNDESQGLTNSTFIVFDDNSQPGKDERDALEFFPLSNAYLLLSTKSSDGVNLDINSVPGFEEEFRLHLAIRSDISRNVTLSLTDVQGLEDVVMHLSRDEWTLELTPNSEIELEIEPSGAGRKVLPDPGKTSNEFELLFSRPKTVAVVDPEIPQNFELLQNYPNPFNPSTTIRFGLPAAEMVKLSVYNILGQLVDVLVNESFQAGYHTVNFTAENLSSGVYLFRIEAGPFVQSRKMVLMK